MCGRVDLHTPPSQLARLLEVTLAQGVDPDGAPSWNVPPTQRLYAVTEVRPRTDHDRAGQDTRRVLDQFRWGLVPHWATDVRMGNKMINARAETVAKTPAYRSAFATHRCLIVVDGFYEWQVPDRHDPKKKVPYYFHRADGRPITFAGLYDTWWDKSRSSEPDPETLLRTCTIITTEAGSDMVEVHNRMPVILDHQTYDPWLDRHSQDTDALQHLLRPAPGGTLLRHPVSTEVNSPRHDGPQLLAAVTPAAGSAPADDETATEETGTEAPTPETSAPGTQPGLW
jgi:putative SOS response-associated peptidase YedK